MTSKGLIGVGLAVAMFVAGAVGMAVPASADPAAYAVTGTTCSFNKYLIMDAGDSVPNATFSFTIAGGTPREASAGSYAVMAGIGSPVVGSATFGPSNTTATEAGTNIDVARVASERSTGLTAATGVQLETGEKYATQQVTIDFSGVTFTEPGIYRYVVSEVESPAQAATGIMCDNDSDRILDVYVIDSDGALSVAAYVLHTQDGNVGGAASLPDKTDGFTNECNTKDLRVSKDVAGNQASRDKYFEVTVKVTDGVQDGDSFQVSLADDSNDATNDGNADAMSGAEKTGGTIAANAGKTNATSVTGAQLSAGQKFYLRHGQSIVVRGLPISATYEVTENSEDYSSATMSGRTNSGTIGTVAGDGKLAEAGFVNTRQGTIPTGVFLYAGIGVGAIALAMVVIIGTRKHKELFE